jgi:hypothetical protein
MNLKIITIKFLVAVFIASVTIPGGVVMAFGAPSVPKVTTRSASDISSSAASLGASVNSNGFETGVWFEWGLAPAGLLSITQKQTAGSGTAAISMLSGLSNLNPDTLYYFRAVAENEKGISYGSTLSFRTKKASVSPSSSPSPSPAVKLPSVSTQSADSITSTKAVLRGQVTPQGQNTKVWFEFGSYANSLTSETAKQNAGSGSRFSFIFPMDGLSPETTYFYRAVAENEAGKVFGSAVNFKTKKTDTASSGSSGSSSGSGSVSCRAPYLRPLSAVSINDNSAKLRGSVDPKSYSTSVWFEYGKTGSYGSATAKQTISGSMSDTEASAYVSGLSSGTKYYYRIIAENQCGRSNGSQGVFTTTGVAAPSGSAGSSGQVGQYPPGYAPPTTITSSQPGVASLGEGVSSGAGSSGGSHPSSGGAGAVLGASYSPFNDFSGSFATDDLLKVEISIKSSGGKEPVDVFVLVRNYGSVAVKNAYLDFFWPDFYEPEKVSLGSFAQNGSSLYSSIGDFSPNEQKKFSFSIKPISSAVNGGKDAVFTAKVSYEDPETGKNKIVSDSYKITSKNNGAGFAGFSFLGAAGDFLALTILVLTVFTIIYLFMAQRRLDGFSGLPGTAQNLR